MKRFTEKTDPDNSGNLAVLLPFEPFKETPGKFKFSGKHIRWGLVLIFSLLAATCVGETQAALGKPGIIMTIFKWTPLLLKGFGFNILISFMSMSIGTVLGICLGLCRVSLLLPVRTGSWFMTQFFRNSPWLVILFYCIFMIPFEIEVFGFIIPMPDWFKAVIGLSLPIMANVAEIVRGAVQSVPIGQWEAAESLAFSRLQTLWKIILPQCIKRMIPPWMNWYAILTMSTPLCSVVGVSESMTLTGEVLAAEQRPELLIPIYIFLLSLFFLYCYPIAKWTQNLERKYVVKQ